MSQHALIIGLVEELSGLLRSKSRTLATIESCTGGMVGSAIVEPDGATDVYVGGFVTYSDESKRLLVGVKSETLASHGAVSPQVAIEMAQGGARKLLATNSIAITGIAGSGGGSIEKPVGTVWICVADGDGAYDCRRFVFPGDRTNVRTLATIAAISMCIGLLKGEYQTLEHQLEAYKA